MSDEVPDPREQVIDEIRRAFADVSREDGVTLHEAEVIDDYGSTEERAAARRLDTDLRWQDVPDRLIQEYSDTLCFVDVKGFRYYLPAYMIWAMRNHETTDSLSATHPIFCLTLSDNPTHREWHLERFRAFDGPQARAIGRFLRFMAERADPGDAGLASRALDAYWGRFCRG